MTRFTTAAILAVSFGLLGSGSALAGGNDVSVNKVSVAYGDLNLSSDAGAKILFARVGSAASLACGGHPDSRDLAGAERFQACRKEAIAGAVTRIGAPKLSALNGQAAEQVASAQ
jgi:UrcA family protein